MKFGVPCWGQLRVLLRSILRIQGILIDRVCAGVQACIGSMMTQGLRLGVLSDD